jgi:cytochrome c553
MNRFGKARRQSARLVGAIFLLVCQTSSLPSADRAFGEYLAAECVACHRLTDRQAGIPPLVGLSEAVFTEILTEYQQGKRENPTMRMIANRLSSEEIAALAAYFGSLPRGARSQ